MVSSGSSAVVLVTPRLTRRMGQPQSPRNPILAGPIIHLLHNRRSAAQFGTLGASRLVWQLLNSEYEARDPVAPHLGVKVDLCLGRQAYVAEGHMGPLAMVDRIERNH